MGLFDKLRGKKGIDKVVESSGTNTQTPVLQETDGILYIAEIPYETGELHYRYSRKLSPDGTKWIRDGLFQEFYKNGSLGSEGLYNDGVEDGSWKDYHENGKIAAEGNYSNGKEIGIWRYYDEQGMLEEEENY